MSSPGSWMLVAHAMCSIEVALHQLYDCIEYSCSYSSTITQIASPTFPFGSHLMLACS